MKEIEEKSDYQLGMEIAWQAFSDNDMDSAATQALSLIEKYPGKVNNHYLLGHIYLDQKNISAAIANFETALKNDKTADITGHIYYWLGIIYGMGGPFSEFDGSVYDKDCSIKYFNQSRETGRYPVELLFELSTNIKGQPFIELCEEGIKMFPENTNFFLMLAKEYKRIGLFNKQSETLARAIEFGLSSASLNYNIGRLKFSQNDFNSAIEYFTKAVSDEKAGDYKFAIYYLIGKANLSLGEFEQAKTFFIEAYNSCTDHDERLFGLFGLLELYIQTGDSSSIVETITNLEVSTQLFNEYGLFSGGPVYLGGRYPDTIEIDNLDALYKSVTAVATQSSNSFFNAKLFLIKAFLASTVGKYYDAHKAMLSAWKYNVGIGHDLLLSLHYDIINKLLEFKCDTPASLKKTLRIVLADLENYYGLSAKLTYQIEPFIDTLFKQKEYKGIVDFANFYSPSVLSENDVIFKVAYSYAEIKDHKMAKDYYEYDLANNKRTSAVLNNLANLYEEDDIIKALSLYEEGVKLNPKDEIINRNLERTRKLIQQEEMKSAREKAQKENYNNAVKSLRYENDYILDKLHKFVVKAKLEDGFDNWQLPIAKYKFHVLPGVDKQKGEQLREQWLAKEYIVDTGERDDRNVIIYDINPYLEEAIPKIQKHKVPEKWLTGFMNISIGSLEDINYFDLIERIGKVNRKYQPLIERDFKELVHNYLMGHEKATIVLSGSLVELILIYYCEKKKMMTITVIDSKGNPKKKKLYDCVLIDLIEFVEQAKPFGNDFYHLSNLNRIYRNFIHPGKELKDSLDKSKADICFVSTKEILNRII